jgi:ATP-dependent RNA helicase DDX5/DBP2
LFQHSYNKIMPSMMKDNSPEAKAARKAARKAAKKAAKLAADSTAGKRSRSEEPVDAPLSKKQRKAEKKAKKAAKKAKKAAKEAKKAAAVEATDTDATGMGVPGAAPVVPEKKRRRSLSFDTTSNVLVEEPPKAAGGKVDVDAWRAEHEIEIVGMHESGAGQYAVPDPLFTFSSTPFRSSVLQAIKSAGFEAPTPIQSQSWPIALAGRDIISIARTGSGKTCGFLLPVFEKIHAMTAKRQHTNRDGPLALVLAPTRELAMQIQAEALKFGRPQGIRSVVLYGGAPKRRQIGELERGVVHMIVATPGRLNDLLDMRKTTMNRVACLVLDEADRMLDMGFEPQVSAPVQPAVIALLLLTFLVAL